MGEWVNAKGVGVTPPWGENFGLPVNQTLPSLRILPESFIPLIGLELNASLLLKNCRCNIGII
jgi:hypothetical protein